MYRIVLYRVTLYNLRKGGRSEGLLEASCHLGKPIVTCQNGCEVSQNGSKVNKTPNFVPPSLVIFIQMHLSLTFLPSQWLV